MSSAAALNNWELLADQAAIDETVKALQANGFNVIVAETGEEAKRAVLDLLPPGSEVFTGRSATLTALGLDSEIDQSGHYQSLRSRIMGLNRETQRDEMRRIGSAPAYAIGSVHAITRKGEVLIASYGGSQLAPYVYGAASVIWVVGTQKLVNTLDDGFRRIEEHSLPLESERLQKALGVPSAAAKILIYRKEPVANRVTIVLVKEKLGF